MSKPCGEYNKVDVSDLDLVRSEEFDDVRTYIFRTKDEYRYFVYGQGWNTVKANSYGVFWCSKGYDLREVHIYNFTRKTFAMNRYEAMVAAIKSGKLNFVKHDIHQS